MAEKITTLFWGIKGPFDLTLLPQSTSTGHVGNGSYMIKNIKGEEQKYRVNIIFPDVVVKRWGRQLEKAYVCMTDKGWIALNLSRKKKLLLMGSVGLRQRTPEYEKNG